MRGASQVRGATEPRTPLSRQRVLEAAIALADETGIESLTMRRLAEELGAEAMSLYYHVANKKELLDGVVDLIAGRINEVVDELEPAATAAGWHDAARRRILAAREVMLRHPWAPRLFESRTSTSAEVLLYNDGLIATLRKGGFSYDLIHHAMHALGSRSFGFSQELFDPSSSDEESQGAALIASLSDRLPNLLGMLAEVAHDDPETMLGWCDDQTEFEFGLDIVLDGLDRLRRAG